MKKKAIAVRKPADSPAITQVKSAYSTIALSPAGQSKLEEMRELVAFAAEQTSAARDISITDDETDLEGKNILVNLRKARKAGEELQKFFTSPLEAAKKSIIATFKAMGLDAAEQEDRLTKEANALFMAKLAAQRAETDRIAAEQRAAEEKARRTGRAVVAPAVEAPAVVERVAQVDNGTTSQGTEFKAMFEEGVNLEIVPRQYLRLDESRVREAVKSGVRIIPGISIREVPKLAVR